MKRSLAAYLIILGVATAGAAGTPTYRPEETRYPHRARCALNLLEIGQRVQTYVLARDGEYPPALSAVFALPGTTGEEMQSLICPAARRQVSRDELVTNYAYVHLKTPPELPPLPGPEGEPDEPDADDPDEPDEQDEPDEPDEPDEAEEFEPFMMVFDAEPVHQQGRNVLFSDLELQYMPEAEFQALLAEQSHRFEREGREYEIVWEDSIALTEQQYRALRRPAPFHLRSPHFLITLGLLAAIAGVLLALASLKKRQQAESEDTP